jgi:hypothetical protein
MEKAAEFQPGSFLRVNDLLGGKKIVQVGQDGVTFLDCIDTSKVTPIPLHPIFEAESLGTISHFVRTHQVSSAVVAIMEFLEQTNSPRRDDSLFIMRMLLNVIDMKRPEGWLPPEPLILSLYDSAENQERSALEIHKACENYIQKFH